MATVKRFEDLEIWKEARVLCQQVFEVTSREPFVRDFSLKNQIRDASGSVMDNIAEGFERGGTREFVNHLSYAKGSCGEVRSQIYRAFVQCYISKPEFEALFEKSVRINNGISGFMKYLNSTEIKGTKFKSPGDKAQS